MTSGQKIAFSFLSAFILFTAAVLTLHTFLFDKLETKFYRQARIEENVSLLNDISESYDQYIDNILNILVDGEGAYFKDAAVKSFYDIEPSASVLDDRREKTEQLFRDLPTLDGMRILDKNGKNVHYSTYDDTDLIYREKRGQKEYKNYNDIVDEANERIQRAKNKTHLIKEIPFDVLSKKLSQTDTTILFDSGNSRVIIAVPFYWVDDIYAGSALLYFRLIDIENEFVRNDIIDFGQSLQIIADDTLKGGFVVGVPYSLKNEFIQPILKYQNSEKKSMLGLQLPEKLLQKEDGSFYVALSSTLKNDKPIVGVYSSDIFELPIEVKIVIYLTVFISLYLLMFLIFSFKQDPVVVLKARIKAIQYGVIKEYLNNKEEIQWQVVEDKLKARKTDLNKDIMKTLNVRAKKRKQELDAFLEKSWDDVFTFISENEKVSETSYQKSIRRAPTTVEVIEEEQPVVKRVVVKKPVVEPVVEEIEEVEELDDVEPIEEVEELDEVEPIEEVEEIEDAEEIEDLDDVEDIDELDEVEELEEAEEIEELDDAEEIEDAEEVEELEDAEEIEDAEEVEELEDAEEIEELDEVEELDEEEIKDESEVEEEIEELDEVEEIEELEEETDVTLLDKNNKKDETVSKSGETVIENIDDVEELEEAEDEIETLYEDVDDVEDIQEEPLDDDIDDVEELEEADPDAQVGPVGNDPNASIWNDDFFKNFCGAFNYEYHPSNATYFAGEEFPSVDNLFAEELAIGSDLRLESKIENPLLIENFPMSYFD